MAAIPTGLAVPVVLARGLRLAFAAPERRAVIRKARRIRRTWRRTAIRVGLAHCEQIKAHAPLGAPGSGRRTLTPAILVRQEAWGVRIDAHTLGRLGLEQFQAAADHLANAWKVPLVRVEQHAPGVIRIRALLRDPLTTKTEYSPENTVTCDPATWSPGVDADGREVTMRSSGVSGVVVAGLAGYGKTPCSTPGSASSRPRRRCSSY
jgi:S-DNA-T family DNA segregation ATPase FtsK/SpoIIIE